MQRQEIVFTWCVVIPAVPTALQVQTRAPPQTEPWNHGFLWLSSSSHQIFYTSVCSQRFCLHHERSSTEYMNSEQMRRYTLLYRKRSVVRLPNVHKHVGLT